MKKKTKPTSVRFDNELLEELDQRCSKVGCSRNDFIKNSVEFAITQQSDFDFGDEEETDDSEEEPKPIVTEIKTIDSEPEKSSMIMHGKILDDFGNVVGTF